jgi:hypothetical protein
MEDNSAHWLMRAGTLLAAPTSSTDEEEVELTLPVAEIIKTVLKEVAERVETTDR